jgi:hypothetical protein
MLKHLITRLIDTNFRSNQMYIDAIPELEEYALLTNQTFPELKDVIVNQVATRLEPIFGNRIQQLLNSEILLGHIQTNQSFDSLRREELRPIVRELGARFHLEVINRLDEAINLCRFVVEENRFQGDSPTSSQLQEIEEQFESDYESLEASSVEKRR